MVRVFEPLFVFLGVMENSFFMEIKSNVLNNFLFYSSFFYFINLKQIELVLNFSKPRYRKMKRYFSIFCPFELIELKD